jgi:hypothetical protein
MTGSALAALEPVRGPGRDGGYEVENVPGASLGGAIGPGAPSGIR